MDRQPRHNRQVRLQQRGGRPQVLPETAVPAAHWDNLDGFTFVDGTRCISHCWRWACTSACAAHVQPYTMKCVPAPDTCFLHCRIHQRRHTALACTSAARRCATHSLYCMLAVGTVHASGVQWLHLMLLAAKARVCTSACAAHEQRYTMECVPAHGNNCVN